MKAWNIVCKSVYALCAVWGVVILVLAVHYGWRALMADTFIIPSDSMSPTLLPGDKVRVDKTIFGARLYTSLDFTDGRMESVRTRGRRGLRYNDIVVFNYRVQDELCVREARGGLAGRHDIFRTQSSGEQPL